MIVTSLADPWMLRFAYGAFLIGRLLIGLICMRWLLLLVIHQMVRVHWLVLTRAVATYITHQLMNSLPQEVHQRYLSHLLIHEFGLLMVLIWFKSLKKPEEGSVSHTVQQLAKYMFLKGVMDQCF
ncbi:uncharacterized protein [Arachis hypogaea]|uniref:uncharacterized protein isoform X5 n=1 Tax=Arachis hypogaea TaxID=3818 RepID=UPI003B211FDB